MWLLSRRLLLNRFVRLFLLKYIILICYPFFCCPTHSFFLLHIQHASIAPVHSWCSSWNDHRFGRRLLRRTASGRSTVRPGLCPAHSAQSRQRSHISTLQGSVGGHFFAQSAITICHRSGRRSWRVARLLSLFFANSTITGNRFVAVLHIRVEWSRLRAQHLQRQHTLSVSELNIRFSYAIAWNQFHDFFNSFVQSRNDAGTWMDVESATVHSRAGAAMAGPGQTMGLGHVDATWSSSSRSRMHRARHQSNVSFRLERFEREFGAARAILSTSCDQSPADGSTGRRVVVAATAVRTTNTQQSSFGHRARPF